MLIAQARYCARVLLVVVAVLLSFSILSVAQTAADLYVSRVGGGATILAPGELNFGGLKPKCKSWPTVLDPNLNDVGTSFPGFIVMHQKLIAKISSTVNLWIYYHECSHLLGVRDELEADCYSVRRGRTDGWLKRDGVVEICEFIGEGRATANHPTGLDRCAAMRACFDRKRR